MSLGVVMALSVCALGQRAARKAGTEKSDVLGATLFRAKAHHVKVSARAQAEEVTPEGLKSPSRTRQDWQERSRWG